MVILKSNQILSYHENPEKIIPMP